ncbi:MAG: T9SS type A sorting domain-containing protein [Bacteroidetes bacterium]|nr:T9SS type A sorting domain-containing protein [Bacteroidota bacterium]
MKPFSLSIGALVLLFLTFPVLSFSQGWREKEMEIRISINRIDQASLLQSQGIYFEGGSRHQGYVPAYVTPTELEIVRNTGIPFEVTIPDMNAHYAGYWDQDVPPGYYTYEQIISIADSLATAFPSLCKKVSFGTSLGGRQLAALKISDNVNTDEPEPEILLDGGIHGDEVGGSENIIRYARALCLGYNNNPEFTNLINSREIWLYLMVNPDGRVNMSRYNNNMVDINRDMGYMWNGEGSSPGACSQVEAKALRDCWYSNQFVSYTNYHSGAEIISYPWSYRGNNTPDMTYIDHLASVYASNSGYSSLPYGQGYNVMYPINGSTKDHTYGALGLIGWSMEISLSKQPPSSQIMLYYNRNEPAMTKLVEYVGYGLEGTVTDSLTGLPVAATVWVNSSYPCYNDPIIGDYHKYVTQGSYQIRVTANGYRTKTVTNVAVNPMSSTTVNFQLVPETHQYAYRVVACRIPGNNFSDEGYTPGCLGNPDNVNYSIGKNGWIVVDMQTPVINGPSADIRVYEGDASQEGYTCYVSQSMDGPWVSLGTGTGTNEFELAGCGLPDVRYIKILDDGDGSATGVDIGFDLDALEAIVQLPLQPGKPNGDTLVCNNYPNSDYIATPSPNAVYHTWMIQPSDAGIVLPFGTNCTINWNENWSGLAYLKVRGNNGFGPGPWSDSLAIEVKTSPWTWLGNDTTICTFDSIQFDAGNPGSTYLWSTGETTQTIVVSSPTGQVDTVTYWVFVNLNGCYTTDTIIITYDECNGLALNTNDVACSLLPNPTFNGTFMLRFHKPGDYVAELFNSSGILIEKRHINTSGADTTETFQIRHLPKGIYLLKINSDHQQCVKKIIYQ